jgi:hypothetical protein
VIPRQRRSTRGIAWILWLVLIAAATESAAQDPIGSTLAVSVRVAAVFVHGDPKQPAYESGWTGLAELAFSELPGAASLEFRIGLGDSACRLASLWWVRAGTGAIPTGPIELCLADGTATEAGLEAWIGGQAKAPSPTLKIPLGHDQTSPGSWRNLEAVTARAFLRRCGPGPSGFARYAEVSIPLGALSVAISAENGAAVVKVAASAVALQSADPATWRQVLERCGNPHVPLPAAPLFGLSRNFTTRPVPAQSGTPLLGERVDGLRAAVTDLSADRTLDRQYAADLVGPLDDAVAALREGNGKDAAGDLRRFARGVEQVEARSKLDSQDAQSLTKAGLALESELTTLLTTVPLPMPRPPICLGVDCAFVTFHVERAGLPDKTTPDGSASAPFRSIHEALAEAQRRDACGVAVILHGPGPYTETIEITRHTRITGSGPGPATLVGSIINRTASRLELTGLRLERAPTPGAVIVDHPCADTSLTAVNIVNAEHHGIWQRGGTLRAGLVGVVGTRAGSSLVTEGTGIFLTGGAVAEMGLLDVARNQSGGIVVDGMGTRLSARVANIVGNTANPSFDYCALGEAGVISADQLTAGVVARAGANVSLSLSRIEDNALLGILLAGGAQGLITSVAVRSTDDVTCRGFQFFGHNVASLDEASLRLTGFALFGAPICGVILARGGTVDASDGSITRNAIGACIQTTDYALERLTYGVRFRDNGVNIECGDPTCAGLPSPIPPGF